MPHTMKQRYDQLKPFLNEHQRRLFVATEALAYGRGGIAFVERELGVSHKVIQQGIRELEHPEQIDVNRIRKAGGGRKRTIDTDPTLLRDLLTLIDPVTRGEPDSPLRWTSKSTLKLAAALKEMGHATSERWAQLEQLILARPGTRCAIGVSRLSADPTQLKPLYEEAGDCLRAMKFQYRMPVLFAEDAAELSAAPVPDSALQAVLQVVRNQEHELIPRAVERLLAEAGAHRLEQATIGLSRLASDLAKIAESGVAGGLAKHADFLEHYQRIWDIPGYEELRAWLEQLCLKAHEKLRALNAVQTHDVAGEAIAYIRQHYADPSLSLNGLADKLAISPPYLSRMITETTGSSFPDFVNLVRLEFARSLLAEDLDLDIRAVAERSGYSSSTYFTTLFKKRYGMTPTKWRLSRIVQPTDSDVKP
ncbi:helix-turn-helix domain-containing protein [Cohnella fermenti]|uniref:Helix-turn-helix domain-containing protein n=1 Tax=Cohnella fermenti TaxID=2565925 RepID=A0A4S4BRV1_9BACL|nr:helix-turn-helix domain-containing protein [Cohnella fermenti]THF77754.1 helix-turn-helix domain-containing protein [Cohnella fermenti]